MSAVDGAKRPINPGRTGYRRTGRLVRFAKRRVLLSVRSAASTISAVSQASSASAPPATDQFLTIAEDVNWGHVTALADHAALIKRTTDAAYHESEHAQS